MGIHRYPASSTILPWIHRQATGISSTRTCVAYEREQLPAARAIEPLARVVVVEDTALALLGVVSAPVDRVVDVGAVRPHRLLQKNTKTEKR